MVVVLTCLAGTAAAGKAIVSGRVTDTATKRPVEGVTVHLSAPWKPTRVVITDADGSYAATVDEGTYDVLIVYGTSRVSGRIAAAAGTEATFDAQIDVRSGERIVLEGTPPVAVLPKPKDFSSRKAPPYSEQAVLRDAWTRAWMLLDISAQGAVTRFKFLKRPGFELEAIAASEVFRLRFEPARDTTGRPVRTWLVWGIEWPSNGWLVAMLGVASGLPSPELAGTIPCAGDGPWNMDAYATYRDCSQPDLRRARVEPWIVHDPHAPPPATAWD